MQEKNPINTRARNITIVVAIALLVSASVIISLWHSNMRNIPPGGSGFAAARQAEDGSTLFMSYAGPIFPLSALCGTDNIAVKRSVLFDFSRFGAFHSDADPHIHHSNIPVQDSYILTNDSDEAQTVQLIYPFVGNFFEYGRFAPTVLKDGAVVETQLLAGAYSGGFVGFDDGNESSINLHTIASWQDYYALLSDGRYLERALGDAPILNHPVIVYEFTNTTADFLASVNPTLAVGFNLDYDRTTVLSYGFHGGSFNPDGGFMRQSFSIPREDSHDADRIFKLIVLGDDISDINMQGYANAGWHPGEEREDISAVMTRRETTLYNVLNELVANFVRSQQDINAPDSSIFNFSSFEAQAAFEMFLRSVSELLFDYGILSDTVAARYETGWLAEMFWEVMVMDRVFYLVFDVAIPADGSTEIIIDMLRLGSFDFFCGSGSKNVGLYGYELVTTLSSSLNFTTQTAVIEGGDYIEIIRQNFGFTSGSTSTVQLESDIPRFFIEVRRQSS